MNKHTFVPLALAVAFSLLASCGSPATGQPTTTLPPSPTESVSAETPTTDIKEFQLKLDDTISSLNKDLASQGYTELTNPIEDSKSTTELGAHTAYTYSLGDGAAFVVYVSNSTGHVLEFYLGTTSSEITDTTMEIVNYLMSHLVDGLSEDSSQAESVILELGLDNTAEDTFATASSSYGEFLYMVQGDSIGFMITPA